MSRNSRSLLAMGLASTILSSMPAWAGPETEYYFRLTSHVFGPTHVGGTTPTTPTNPTTPTDPTVPTDPGGTPDKDTDGDGTPDKDDPDPNDPDVPTCTSGPSCPADPEEPTDPDDVVDPNAVLSFVANRKATPDKPVFSNTSIFQGPSEPTYIFVASASGLLQICDTPSECTEDGNWDWEGTVKAGQYVRLMNDPGVGERGSETIQVEVAGSTFEWFVQREPHKDTDGDGTVDEADPDPLNPSVPSVSFRSGREFYRITVEKIRDEYDDVWDDANFQYPFSEVEMCFVGLDCSNRKFTYDKWRIATSASPTAGGEVLFDRNYDTGNWYVAPGGKATFTFQQQGSVRIPASYGIWTNYRGGWNHFADVTLESSDTGRDGSWRVEEKRVRAHIGYGGEGYVLGK